MPKKISALPTGSALTGAETVPLVQSSVTIRSTVTAIADYVKTLLAVATGAALVGGGAQVVSSVTALRALLKTSPSSKAFVTGYYADGDGGGGAYYYDSADTTSSDNGGTIIVATDGGRWKLVYTGAVSLKQFGAKMDNVTVDTVAVQAAVTWATTTVSRALM